MYYWAHILQYLCCFVTQTNKRRVWLLKTIKDSKFATDWMKIWNLWESLWGLYSDVIDQQFKFMSTHNTTCIGRNLKRSLIMPETVSKHAPLQLKRFFTSDSCLRQGRLVNYLLIPQADNSALLSQVCSRSQVCSLLVGWRFFCKYTVFNCCFTITIEGATCFRYG